MTKKEPRVEKTQKTRAFKRVLTFNPEQTNFYLALCKQGIHSFLIIGMKDSDGLDTTLLRVGKTNMIGPGHPGQAKLFAKSVLTHTKAFLEDEGTYSSSESERAVRYQAYDINYKQLCDLLRLIALIQKNQCEDEALRSVIQASFDKSNESVTVVDELTIQGYLPDLRDPKNPTLVKGDMARALDERYTAKWPKSAMLPLGEQAEAISKSAKKLSVFNTCRTTALHILESMTGRHHNVAISFIKSPKYRTTLKHRQPTYVYSLPHHPDIYGNLDKKKRKALVKLYKQLQRIPAKAPDSEDTKNKFNELKKIYRDIAGPNHANIAEYLQSVYKDASKTDKLFKTRSPSLFSRALARKSSTEHLLKSIEKANLPKPD